MATPGNGAPEKGARPETTAVEASKDTADDERDPAERLPPSVPVVGIGASAGGLEALKELLGALPSEVGACFAIVQHLDPSHKSMLTELLARCTRMPVRQAEDGTQVEADEVIVISPNSTLTLQDGVFHVERPAPPRLHRTPIDSLFRSLAKDQGERAIAIVLSGTGSDGTQGMKEVKEAGGFTLVQDPATAKYDSMPRSAEATGLVDDVLAPADMPGRLSEYLARIRDEAARPTEAEDEDLRSQLTTICGVLKVATGHDFRQYKEPTLLRRVQRRLQVLRIADIATYVDRLRNDKKEARQLFRELLVSVTGFFRDPEAFDALDTQVLKPLVDKTTENDDTIRVWVPGCATGEEAYSIAMALRDKVEAASKAVRLQIFATDIDDKALEVARKGIYPEGIVNNVPDRYLKRFFRARGGDYEVVQEVRELCIFSTQSLIKDPPFSKLDLISCRNVLIYLRPELQNRLIPVFHYALRPGGHLFLGTSENVTRHVKLFDVVNKKWRIFRRREATDRPQMQFPLMNLAAESGMLRSDKQEEPPPRSKRDVTAQLAERAILTDLGPAFVVVGRDRELLYTGGKTQPYLRVPSGAASFEILSMIHDDLRMDVRALLHRAMTQYGDAVREGVSINTPDGRRFLRMVCRRLEGGRDADEQYLIVFNDLGAAPAGLAGADDSAATDEDGDARAHALESELKATKEYLQTTTEELESSNEELKSANEELMSMNEELQSSNEELETSKEELQSINEELETVNAELSHKVEELGRTNADLVNLLESTRIATLFLDRSLRVRKFTPVAREIFHLIDGDLGRPIEDINTRLNDVDLAADARAVVEKLTPIEREVTLRDGEKAYLMCLLPYRTAENVIDGAVATFSDVSRIKRARERVATLNAELEEKVEDLQAVLDLAPIGIAFADNPECRPIQVNEYGSQLLGTARTVPPAGDPGSYYRFFQGDREVPAEDLPLQKAWRTGQPVNDFRATVVTGDDRRFELLMSTAPLVDSEGKVRRVVGVYDDVTELVEAQRAAEQRAAQQDFVATVGNMSLKGEQWGTMAETLPARLAGILDVDFVKLLMYREQTEDFALAGAYGIEVASGTPIEGKFNSQAGYTLQTHGPVIVENLAQEKRFRPSTVLREAGAVSGVSVPIGDPKQPQGVLDVHSRTKRAFSVDEVQFLQAVANVLAATLQRDAWRDRQQLLLRELRHRVKNVLATVQALARLSFRGSRSSKASVSFLDRLQALAEAHDLTLQANWANVDFADIVERQIRPYRDQKNVRVDGPDGIMIHALTGIDISILIHELVTNASKHGALVQDGATLEIIWLVEPHAEREVLKVTWSERGISIAPEATRRQGVGSRMMDAIVHSSGCAFHRVLEDKALVCEIEIPLPARGAAEET